MKSRLFSCIPALIIAGISLFALNSCKEDTILGSNVLPVDDTVNTVLIPDTLTILTKTVYDDSVVTSYSISGVPIYHALGSVTADPVGGKTNAGFYFQIVPPSLGYDFPKTPDSAFLVLPYSGFTWGDTTTMNMDQTIKVYEIADSLSKDSLYYSFSKTGVNPVEIGTATIGYNSGSGHSSIKDSVNVLGVNRAPHVRIRLSQTFLDKIKNEAANGTALGGYADFLRFQPGFYVAADSTTGNALYYFILNGGSDFTMANVQFFYTDQKTDGTDTVKYVSFPFDQTRDAHYNRITRNYTGSQAGTLLTSSAVSDSIVMIQNKPGANLDIKIPHINSLPKQPIVKAELIITQYKFPGDKSDVYFPPSRLFPVRINSSNGSENVQDRYPTSDTGPLVFMDGLRKDVTIDGATYSQYVINLPREVQKAIIEQRDTLHLRLSGPSTFPGAYRLITAGRNVSNDALKVKLRIYYSKI